MALEIERKFQVINADWRAAVRNSQTLVQGYLNLEGGGITRVRIAGDSAWLNIKGATRDIVRHEFEYPIPLVDAGEMLEHLAVGRVVEKRRHHVPYGGWLWEVDEFLGANAGLVVAEIELDDPAAAFARPPWVGREVSAEPRFLNIALVHHPYREWTEAERA
jgi:adenylate cyclase